MLLEQKQKNDFISVGYEWQKVGAFFLEKAQTHTNFELKENSYRYPKRLFYEEIVKLNLKVCH